MYIRLATKADATDQLKRFFTLTILLLGFAVFFWGLHDKLSLYAPPSAPPPMARAKLLSQAEQPSTRADAALPRSPESVPPLFVVLFTALLSLLFSVENRRTMFRMRPVETFARKVPRCSPQHVCVLRRRRMPLCAQLRRTACPCETPHCLVNEKIMHPAPCGPRAELTLYA
jgi:hypothetical protein